ncbi:hypothetical protein H6F77_01730 [Microcoleus sp. FACHB-831]|jgi:polyhydroxyalkanoate synthesis regulator phasin|uniref:hypothetical protein n=1 Tax=Microcoleus sp. FACHB-831 TaxID=2692827 RepID=UPI00168259A6|nr:hypothetical protein [Microcoleus sp. FACHB-831]MBD1919839.1 hypothetical protein [Microcoleus sp. FACHB-831]
MNPDNLIQLVQKGFRVTLGATASAIESVQDAQKRDRNLELLRTDLNQLVEEFADKGAVTEVEARTFVDNMLAQRNNPPASQTTADTPGATETVAPPSVQLDLQELTAQIAAIRIELENLRNPDSNI